MKAETQTELVLELSNSCSCEDEDEETGEVTYALVCHGCYESDVDYFNSEILPSWLGANGWDYETMIVINGSGMGWTRSSGYLVTKASDLLEKFSINGDYTLRMYRKGKDLEIVRSSHDELGAHFTFELAPPESDEDYE